MDQTVNDDQWDDSELLEKFNRSMSVIHQKVEDRINSTMKGENSPGPSTTIMSNDDPAATGGAKSKIKKKKRTKAAEKWSTGAPCQAVYPSDGQWYEGTVTGVEGHTATVELLGYGDVLTVAVADLRPSEGAKKREEQRYEAGDEVEEGNEVEDVEGQERAAMEKSEATNAEQKEESSKCLKWTAGDAAQVRFPDDGQWYEADVLDVCETSGFVTAVLLGWGDEVVANPRGDAIRRSKGKQARVLQQKAYLDHRMNREPNPEECEQYAEDEMQSHYFQAPYPAAVPPYPFPTPHHSFQPHFPPPIPNFGGLPPPPPLPACFPYVDGDALHAMMMSWYMTGYHTGYYMALAQSKR